MTSRERAKIAIDAAIKEVDSFGQIPEFTSAEDLKSIRNVLIQADEFLSLRSDQKPCLDWIGRVISDSWPSTSSDGCRILAAVQAFRRV